jgi:hypothetical protein
MDLYRLAVLRDESLRRTAETTRLVAGGGSRARPADRVRVGLARLLVKLAMRLWPDSAGTTAGVGPALGSTR